MKSKNALGGFTFHNRVKLIRGGKNYFESLIDLIRSAEHSIHLQMYIFDDDETGRSVLNALNEASAKGVSVFMLLDGYASQGLSRNRIAEIKLAGIKFRWFEPLLRAKHFYFGRRLHHKVIIADAARAMVGGINISNRYNDMPQETAWLDWAVFVEGEICGKLFLICQDLWNKAGWGKKKSVRYQLKPEHYFSEGSCKVRIRREDWVRRRTEISRSYIELLSSAEKEVYLMSSYFLPGRVMRKSLARAAARGVKIHVITAGKSDIVMAKNAERYLYRWLLRNKISLYEYQANILHGKISCFDSEFTTIGSYNINFLSAYASIELNLDINDGLFSLTVEQELKKIIESDCKAITETEWSKQYNLFELFLQRSSYDIIRLIFFLFTFYFKQRR
ncbi:phospholipase D-like domain-containing protein [Flavihumibacter sp.]|uniref:phospholipase D-like domain-containing protein n=1 Tax=Flavihumibacter sp. TaxID=1913981 RepID=UPI002FC70912|nr:phospholipase D-like domain-containing protein [Flavihumibacter sediminis]